MIGFTRKSAFLQEIFQTTKRAFLFVAFLSFFVNVLMLTAPLYMLQLFDRVLAGRSTDTLIYLSIIALFAIGILSLLDVLRQRAAAKIGIWLEKKASPYALAHSPDQLLRGEIYHGQSLQDIALIRQFLSSPSIMTFFDFPWFPIYLLAIYLMHPHLGLLATMGAVVLFSLTLINELVTNNLSKKVNVLASLNSQKTQAGLRNAEVIQAMGMMPAMMKNWFENNETVLALNQKLQSRSSFLFSISKGFRLALQIMMLGLGAYYVLQNIITPGVMIVASIMMARALAPLEQSINAWRQMQNAQQAKNRLHQFFSTETGRKVSIELPNPEGALSLENVFYIPPQQEAATLANINVKIPKGRIVALIGPSASGKSTLAKILVGAWPVTRGAARLDGADIYTWDRQDFGKFTGYLPQDVELFSGTIKENIARMGDVDDEKVIEAAKLADVHDLILHCPKGYETVIGAGGYALSGGQRQRIALARALYNDPTLIVLDEPNSNLDKVGEQALVNTIAELKERHKTVVLITHRMPFIRSIDDIILLKDGMIQFAGPKEKILEQIKGGSSYGIYPNENLKKEKNHGT